MAKRAKKTKVTEPRAKAARPEPFYRPFAPALRVPRKTDPRAGASGPEPNTPAGARAPTRSSKPAPPASLETVDTDSFAFYMAGVRALPDNRAHRVPRTAHRVERSDRGARSAEDPDAEARHRMRSLVTEGLRFETLDDGERIEGRRIDVDPRELRRLRRGQFAIDGKLDLHDFTLVEARHAVEAFVKKRALDGDRVVVLVHGKGSHSPRGVGILRGEIAAWLTQGRSARHVAAFATALDGDGGHGALLVLLAR